MDYGLWFKFYDKEVEETFFDDWHRETNLGLTSLSFEEWKKNKESKNCEGCN